jgi:hypothetical protein
MRFEDACAPLREELAAGHDCQRDADAPKKQNQRKHVCRLSRVEIMDLALVGRPLRRLKTPQGARHLF